jgi:hypothetical protein
MPREIHIKDKHIYLNEYDIAPFVADIEVVSKERVIVTLVGNVSDEREKKVVKDGNRKNSRKA